jgi:hypothetical protein
MIILHLGGIRPRLRGAVWSKQTTHGGRLQCFTLAFPVVYMTGAAADEWAIQGVPNSILLAKPFAPAQLVTAISNLLNAGTAAT